MSTMATELELKQLEKRIAAEDAEIAAAQDALEELKAELREGGVTSATITAEDARELTEAQKAIDARKDDVIALRDLRDMVLGAAARSHGPVGNRELGRAASFHGLLFGADDYRQLTPERLLGNSPIGAMPSVEVFGRDETVRRLSMGAPLFALPMYGVATADLDAGIPLDERLYPTVETLRRRVRLLDLITVGATDSDTVVYSRQTARTSAAAETALGTAYSEAAFDFEQVTANVRSIGHFTTAYRENIADAAQFDTLVRRQLEEDVLLRLESQIYAGNGAGVNLEGITTNGSIESVTRDTTNETRIDVIHRGMTLVRLNFREPDAIVVHPNDYQDIVFEKDTTDRHMLLPGGYTSPGMAPTQSLWGLPLVVSPVATEGVGLVGYFRDATLWVRSGVSLAVSDSHDDYFVKRQVAILAEMRGAFSVQRPGAFCEVNLI